MFLISNFYYTFHVLYCLYLNIVAFYCIMMLTKCISLISHMKNVLRSWVVFLTTKKNSINKSYNNNNHCHLLLLLNLYWMIELQRVKITKRIAAEYTIIDSQHGQESDLMSITRHHELWKIIVLVRVKFRRYEIYSCLFDEGSTCYYGCQMFLFIAGKWSVSCIVLATLHYLFSILKIYFMYINFNIIKCIYSKRKWRVKKLKKAF